MTATTQETAAGGRNVIVAALLTRRSWAARRLEELEEARFPAVGFELRDSGSERETLRARIKNFNRELRLARKVRAEPVEMPSAA